MFEDRHRDETEVSLAHIPLSRASLMNILSGPNALILMILSIISYGVSTYFLIRFIQLDFMINFSETVSVNISSYDPYLYVSIILGALLPLFYIGVYFNARKLDAHGTSRWFYYAYIYMKISFVLVIIGGIFGFIGSYAVLMVLPSLGIIMMIFIGVVVPLSLWIIHMIMKFFLSLENNLNYRDTVISVNPTNIIILCWVSLVISSLSLFSGALPSYQSNGILPRSFLILMNMVSFLSGVLGFLSIVFILRILSEIKKGPKYQ